MELRNMIKVATEKVVALGRAGKHFPRRRRGQRPHPATLYRWAKSGVRSDDGEVVVLVSMDPNPYAVTEPELLRSLTLS
jgi:hypothetical protein